LEWAAWDQAVESFYKGTLLDEVAGNHIKLNISKEKVLDWIDNHCR
jgi:hypothetical protein